MAGDDHFLSRWSRRKALVRQGMAPPEPAPPPAAVAVPVAPIAAPDLPAPVPALAEAPAEVPEVPPPPTLDDVALLDRSSDYTRFVASDVPAEVKNAALKKLFTDPHFNVMDGLDIYIEDYGKPDPLPASMLRQMASAHALGLFRDDPAPDTPTATAQPAEGAPPSPAPACADDAAAPAATDADPTPPEPAHEDPDLRLQPNDAAGCAGDPRGAREDAGREH
ncbi:MAG: DUF3306 domain-containing protein [Ideonella sp.]|nr:DUF3306 domain-containing protein [Ideonella sp.]